MHEEVMKRLQAYQLLTASIEYAKQDLKLLMADVRGNEERGMSFELLNFTPKETNNQPKKKKI